MTENCGPTKGRQEAECSALSSQLRPLQLRNRESPNAKINAVTGSLTMSANRPPFVSPQFAVKP